ncbi:BRCA1-associated RING domain protein 1 [Hordeum vulgare subsp. vulgare]|uniref:RING-type E3 ubiquitin transferase BRCA1 n=1 Tax=Hordeum vulgare subsp. vulgare TaxID=112509 RepID=A0A8I6XMS2_HORVV|nr:BRCA1-associated RING domain protein 1 [Hordeum vulgare subsp. vulgare]
MEGMRRFVNPLKLNVQKMELELTCPVCLKLLSAPTMLPCCHTCCSKCATTQAMNGHSCAICKLAYHPQDLRPASQIEALVNIQRSISSTVSSMSLELGNQAAIPVAKVASQQTPESGTTSSYNLVTSLLPCNQSAGPANENVDGAQAMDPAPGNRTDDVKVEPTVIVQTGPCGSQTPNGSGDLECDSNYLEGELITSGSPPQSTLKRGPNVTDDHTRGLKRQKSSDQSEKQPSMTGWKCEFCHTSEISQCTGPFLHCLNEELVKDDQAWKSNVLHVHEKCAEWAPQAYFEGDMIKRLESEVARSSKMKCGICGLKGAALGCLVKSCRKSYHLPCARGVSDCRWDEGEFVMLCPSHSSKRLPCERSKSKNKKAAQPQQPSSDTTVLGDSNSPFPMEMNELWTSFCPASEWVICGSALSDQDKEILNQFEYHSGVTTTNNWSSNVTHVLANTNEHGACGRTRKVLLAILAGKWVVNVNWLNACLEAKKPVPEEPYEISSDVHGAIDGPRIGRLRAMQKAPSLFSGLAFYFIGQPLTFKVELEELIAAAGGSILGKADLSSTSLIVYNKEIPKGCNEDAVDEVFSKREAEALDLATTFGCRVVPHTWVLDSIASCTLQPTGHCI